MLPLPSPPVIRKRMSEISKSNRAGFNLNGIIRILRIIMGIELA